VTNSNNDSKGVFYPTKVARFNSSEDPVAMVSCGAFHTVAVTSIGSLFSWGKEEFGCLGIYFTGDRLVSGVYKPQKVKQSFTKFKFMHIFHPLVKLPCSLDVYTFYSPRDTHTYL
jgi:alpha-tubulin suppressor-like RCC1 family protein